MKKFDLSLYLVSDRNSTDFEAFLNTIEESLKAGITFLQIREKDISTREFLEIAQKTKSLAKKYQVPMVINDRIDIALATDADGVHLGQNDMPLDIARKILGKDKIIGISANTLEDALRAEKEGADYIGVGAIFNTSTKANAKTIDRKLLETIIDTVNLPIVLIGGINSENASELTDYKIEGLAISSAIMKSKNPGKATESLVRIWRNSFEK